uniref:Uncharacterized protein n=1 Tax=Oryza nivara TaxID=4536 RepID=A0A0E0H1I6_ORYNI
MQAKQLPFKPNRRPRSLRRHRSSPNPRPPAQPRVASPVALVRLGGAPPRAGEAPARAQRVEEAAVLLPAVGNTLRPRRTSNFGGLDLLMEFSFRARTGRPPTSSPANRDI